ncbi:MAG: CorA family divalent cation transporter [Pseudomonadota bacterium]
MITSLIETPSGLVSVEGRVEQHAVWVDLSDPTETERAHVEHTFNVKLPHRVHMRAVEPSTRLVASSQHLEMTFSAPSRDPNLPASPMTCILAEQHLITLHGSETRGFEATRRFAAENPDTQAHDIFIMLVEETVDVIADRLEQLGADIDSLASSVFDLDGASSRASKRIHGMVKRMGRYGTLTMRLQDALTSLMRLSLFMSQHQKRIAPHLDNRSGTLALGADIKALSELAGALDDKVDFILNAMLGIIALDQNKITMVLSMMAAMFLPPTLISSIFGMNFVSMPGLSWHHGFFLCLGAMVGASMIVGGIFRWRRWL